MFVSLHGYTDIGGDQILNGYHYDPQLSVAHRLKGPFYMRIPIGLFYDGALTVHLPA